MDQIPGRQAADRIEIKAGKLAPTDDFDQNRYANNGRTQFMNYDFLFNTAWDYASDTRGYSIGFSAALVHPTWRLILGSYQEPRDKKRDDPGQRDLQGKGRPDRAGPRQMGERPRTPFSCPSQRGKDGRLQGRHGLRLCQQGPYRNHVAVQTPGKVKYGCAINIEQPLANDGDTGIFARLGWANGNNSNWSYTDSDRHASIGLQMSGKNWGRQEDGFGIAFGVNGITSSHQHYLEQGGIAMLIGDGALELRPGTGNGGILQDPDRQVRPAKPRLPVHQRTRPTTRTVGLYRCTR